MKKSRIWELDFLRGFAIFMMIFDHLLYDLQNLNSIFVNFWEVDNTLFNWLDDFGRLYWYSDLRFFGHLFFISLFLIVSGISYTFSKSNLSRGIKLLIVALLINLVTYLIDVIFDADVVIAFGIIHMYSLSILIIYLIKKIWDNDKLIFFLGSLIIVIGILIEFWDFNYIYQVKLIDIPGLVIGTKAYGADSFGLVPYIGIMMMGTVIGNSFYKNKVSLIPTKRITNKNFFTWIGRNSLLIFILHQFVLYGIIILVGYFYGYRV